MTDRLKDPKPDTLARANARDAIEMLDAFRNPATGDIAPVSKLAEAVASIAVTLRQTTPDAQWNSPEWIAERLLSEAAGILEAVGEGRDVNADARSRKFRGAV